MIHLTSGDYFSLNPVGTVVWESIDGNRTVEDLVSIVVSQYDVDTETAQADVLNLVQSLLDEGLVVLVQ